MKSSDDDKTAWGAVAREIRDNPAACAAPIYSHRIRKWQASIEVPPYDDGSGRGQMVSILVTGEYTTRREAAIKANEILRAMRAGSYDTSVTQSDIDWKEEYEKAASTAQEQMRAVKEFLSAKGHDLCPENRRKLAKAFGLSGYWAADTDGVSFEEFCTGCANYQQRLYGQSERAAVVASMAGVVRMYEKLTNSTKDTKR